MNADQKKRKVRDVVTEHYLQTREGLTAQEVAEIVGWSKSTTRKWLEQAPGILSDIEHRTTYSRDYPGMECGSTIVKIYFPGRTLLAELALEFRSALEAEQEAAAREVPPGAWAWGRDHRGRIYVHDKEDPADPSAPVEVNALCPDAERLAARIVAALNENP